MHYTLPAHAKAALNASGNLELNYHFKIETYKTKEELDQIRAAGQMVQEMGRMVSQIVVLN